MWACGCAADVDASGSTATVSQLVAPTFVAPEHLSIGVGDALVLRATNLVAPTEGYVEATFRGAFEPTDGSAPSSVNFTVPLARTSDTTLEWKHFGDGRVPFVRAGDTLGAFHGTIFLTNRTFDGRSARQPESSFKTTEVVVEPSLVVRTFMPGSRTWTASCTNVPTGVLNDVPYRLSVQALGFDPAAFRYTVSEGLSVGEQAELTPTVVEHEATGARDELGVAEPLRFATVPAAQPRFRASIEVVATDTAGNEHSLFIPFVVHPPIELRYDGNVQVAELYEPTPVSGCIPGGINGRDVTYSETHSETRTRTLSVAWTTTNITALSTQHSETYGQGDAASNSIGWDNTQGSNWNWNVHGEIRGEMGTSAVGKVGFAAGGGVGGGGSSSTGRSGSEQWSKNHSYSESLDITQSESMAQAETQSDSLSISSTQSEALDFRTFLLPNQFGTFYRQTTRLLMRGTIVAYDLCDNPTEVGEMTFNDYTWAPDLAMAPSCPPLPTSQLPPAQCLIAPCR